MRAPETLGDSQTVCNVVEETSWPGAAFAGRGIPLGCLCHRTTDQTVRRRCWGRREVADRASALGHCLGFEEVSDH